MITLINHKYRWGRAILGTVALTALLVCGFALGNTQALAGPNIWTSQVGQPLGGLSVTGFDIEPSGWLVIAYQPAPSAYMVYRSTDKGKTWERLHNQTDVGFGDAYSEITGIGMSGNNVFVQVFPGYETHGGSPDYFADPVMLRSTDGGASWGPPVLKARGQAVRFTFGGAEGQTVYAAAAPHIIGTSDVHSWYGMHGGLYKSTDAGATWITLTVGIDLRNVLLDPADNNHVWAAGNGGLAESRDGGATWSILHNNPEVGGLVLNDSGSSTTLYTYGIIPPANPNENVMPTTGPLYKSTDAGRTWKRVSIKGAPAEYSVSAYTVAGVGHLLVSWQSQPNGQGQAVISESLDGGNTWRDLNSTGLNLADGPPRWLAIDEPSGNLLSLGYVDGLSKLVSYTTVAEQPDPAFNALWQHQDAPVQQGVAARSWTWGPQAFATMHEPLQGVPGNSRIVQYYDKSRMEVNDPSADRSAPWFVTNGLLTVEMVAGRVQTGLNTWEPRAPAQIPVAGDANPRANRDAPTYASFGAVASYEGDKNKYPTKVGSLVNESINGAGVVGSEVPPASQISQVKLASYDAASSHNIAAPFWEYLNRKGKVLENGKYVDKPLFGDWVFVMGHPISEPYWTRISVINNGKTESPWVMVQLFERRVLTYTPDNPPEWQVEMGNVGLHYYLWRYGDSQ